MDDPKRQRPNPSQSVATMFAKSTEYNRGTPREKRLTDIITYMLAVDKLPTSLVEGKGARKLLSFLAPSYKIPTAETFRNKLKAKYAELKEITEKKVEEASHISATRDIWTDLNNISYLGITVHFSIDFQMRSVALALFPLNDRHTARYIEDSIRKVLDQWKIPMDKVVSFTTDGGLNIKKAIQSLLHQRNEECDIWCAAQRLDITAKEAVKSADVELVLDKVKELAAFFKRSVNAADALRSAQQGQPLKLIQSVSTRWNSTFKQLERYVSIKEPVEEALHRTKRQSMALTERENKIVEACRK